MRPRATSQTPPPCAVAAACLLLAGLGCGSASETERGGGGEEAPAPAEAGAAARREPTRRLSPDDLKHLGAFRLPGGDERPLTFAYGGNAMGFRPDGDPGGGEDGFPGSLFITGHDRMPYGELPDGSRLAEVSIPAPARAAHPSGLPRARLLQGFADATGGLFAGLDEIPRIGLAYLDHPATGPRLHLAWGQHFQEEPRPSHGLIRPALKDPEPRGPWYLGTASLYAVNGYLFAIPRAWAERHARGRVLATGRYRDGGWSGKGPALFAYAPWVDATGALPPPEARIPATTLLLYEDSQVGPDVTQRALDRYQHADEWEGGAWITTRSGKQAVVFAGTKGTGARFWYGWIHPDDPERPCVETALVEQFTTCWRADGRPCAAADLGGCSGHSDYRGWWSSRFDAQLLFYDPVDLARVAAGELAPHEPQPYARLDIDEHLFRNPDRVEEEALGAGELQRTRVGAVAYDRDHDRLYLLEPFAEGTKPVVHAFSLE